MRVRRVPFAAALFAIAFLVAGTGCERFLHKHRVAKLKELPYPTCPGEPGTPNGPGADEAPFHTAHLRSGPFMRDPNVVEHFSVHRRGCLVIANVRQEWPLGTADVEVVYDASMKPLRVWKRMTLPSDPNPLAHAVITRLEARTLPVGMKERHADGSMELAELKGATPDVVFGPGRGLLSLWIRQARLEVGQTTHAVMLNFRGAPEIAREPLRRDPDRDVPELGGRVRVYTVFGRESVYTDDEGWVLGDVAGLRPDAVLKTPPPPAVPPLPMDPVHTP